MSIFFVKAFEPVFKQKKDFTFSSEHFSVFFTSKA